VSLRDEPSPWRDGRFRLFAAGNLINNLGEGMYTFALPLLALSYTGSLSAMALLVAVTPLVVTVAGPFIGHIVDRHGSRVVVVPGLLLQLAASLALNVALLSGPVPIGALYAAEIAVQIGAVSYRGGWLAGIPAMFPDSPGRARGTLSMLFGVSLIAGPALAALLVGSIGFTGLLWLNSITFVAPIVVWFLGVNPVDRQRLYRVDTGSLVASLSDGARIFLGGSRLGVLMWLTTPVSFVFSTGTITLFVFVASSQMRADASAIGVALAVANIGGVAGALATSELPRWKMRAIAVGGLLCTTACLVVLGAGVGLIVATVALTAFLVCDNVLTVATEMEMFSSVPPALMGRAVGMWRLVTGLPNVAAPAAIAVVAAHLSPNAIFFCLAAVSAAPLAWLLVRRSALRHEDTVDERSA
jgi:MFS family permease